jgi:hypothetical protein
VSDEVGEHQECVVVCFEVIAYPEPKIINQIEFKALAEFYGSQGQAARAIGCSGSIITRSINGTRSRDLGVNKES